MLNLTVILASVFVYALGFVVWLFVFYVLSYLLPKQWENDLFYGISMAIFLSLPVLGVGALLFAEPSFFGKIHWSIPFAIILIAWVSFFHAIYTIPLKRIIGIKRHGYSVALGNAYWAGSKIAGADANTFEVIDSEHLRKAEYAKDKNSVYFKKQKQEGVDPVTFLILAPDLWHDKDNMYYERKVVDSVDINSLRHHSGKCYQDKNGFWMGNYKVEDLPEDFRWLKGRCGRGLSEGKFWKIYKSDSESNKTSSPTRQY